MARSKAGNESGSDPIRLPISVLAADPKNPRKMDDAARVGLAVSLETFGPLDIVFNDETGELVSGHQRIAALKASGAAEVERNGNTGHIVHPKTGERFPVRFVKWDETKQRMANLVANNPAIQGEFDDSAIEQLKALEDEAQFEDLRLRALLDQLNDGVDDDPAEGECDPDDVPEEPAEPFSKHGDLWLLGEHRLLCGDSTSAADVARLMNGERAGLMNTDPPYGIAYVSNAQSKGQAGEFAEIENDELDGPKLQAFLEDMIRAAVPHLSDSCAFYLWHPMLTQGTFFAAAAADILIHRQIIWVKPSLVFGRGDYHWRHELCFYGWVKGKRPPFYGERNQTTIWEIDRENDKIHPTQKPVELFSVPMRNHTRKGDLVYEPFSGSGSQLIAAEQLGRRCFAMELEPRYVDAAVARWEKFTGKKAVRADG